MGLAFRVAAGHPPYPAAACPVNWVQEIAAQARAGKDSSGF